jgi:AraC-like DNA-binding protein
VTVRARSIRAPAHVLTAATSSALSLQALLDAVARRGGAPAQLLRTVGIPPEALNEPDARIPFAALVSAWEIAPRLVGDPALGLHMGAELARGAFGLVEYAARASDRLEDAIARLVRYQRLLHDRARFALVPAGADAALTISIAGAGGPGPRHFHEAMAAALLALARDMTGVAIEPVEVRFTHAAPADTGEHRRLLGPRLRFAAPGNALVVTAATLALPLREGDPGLARVLDHAADHALARLPPLADGVRLCRELIGARIAAGVEPRIGAVARELAVSARSLQRVLTAAGWSFRTLVDDVRRELAIGLVADSDEQAAQIAFRLGYRGASAFHHAFRRWTGDSVGAWRRRARRR